jgi:hypothetical protein
MWNHCKVEQAEPPEQAKCRGGSMKSMKAPSGKSRTINWENILQRNPTYLHLKVLPTSKALKLSHNTLLDINEQLFCSDVQTEAGWMYDELRQSFETFQHNISKLTFNIKHKKNSCICDKWPCMTCSNPKFCQKKLRDAYLNMCRLKREITVIA